MYDESIFTSNADNLCSIRRVVKYHAGSVACIIQSIFIICHRCGQTSATEMKYERILKRRRSIGSGIIATREACIRIGPYLTYPLKALL